MPDKKELIESWVNEMIELFGEKEDDNDQGILHIAL